MVLVDSSVWIDLLTGAATEPVRRFREVVRQEEILVGDLILCEVLQGVRNEVQARQVEHGFRRFETVALADPELVVRAAANYRALRRRGYTVRKTIVMIIGTFCLERGHALLHDDRDFEPMERFLGLETV